MRSQIDELLNYARLGKAPEFHHVSAQAILQSALTSLKAEIDDRSAEISWDPLPEIFADQNLLAQVFQNLVANGLKFQKSGIPHVHISAAKRDSDWIFSVRDNGIGIDSQHADVIFKMFGRLHNNDEFPGSGIGLAISQKIIERHHGHIWFESNHGKGTTFFFSIPRVANDLQPINPVPSGIRAA